MEQFDVQQPELTVRETVLFSARLRLNSESLRLNSEDPNLVDEDVVKNKFVDNVLKTLELTSLSQSIVGTDGEGGLSFEQRKRLSIAVELAASPSIIFLDEVRYVLRFAPLCHNSAPLLTPLCFVAANLWFGCSRSFTRNYYPEENCRPRQDSHCHHSPAERCCV